MKNAFAGIIVFLLVVAGSDSLFVVKETERAVLLQFGEIVRPDLEPGLHFKLPWVNTVRKFDGRILTVTADAQRYLTLEQKALVVDSFAKWRIVDVEQFYKSSSGEESRTSNLLAQRINDGLRNKFGERDLQEVVSGQRDQLMEELTRELNLSTAEEYGIEVIDVRVKQIELPVDVRTSVYDRMTSERQREAQQLRSRGNELAIGIEADADRQEQVLLAEAYSESEAIRGEGDAGAAAIYSAAYSKNEEFYAFTRSLRAYQESFSNKGDILLVDPDSEYFKYLRGSDAQ
ncbi:MAG: protease modulator HflC [Pseudomonadales bacterium]|nr:protease modulator HflC [Pseudomonadales bacterium]MCP5330427.1 protease modulator HflC [Pseudomonadales bacterium]MCP5343960.1 protease modulator HflC [Pseudomonadales bacterium]